MSGCKNVCRMSCTKFRRATCASRASMAMKALRFTQAPSSVVQKQVFQTWFRNMNIAQLYAGSGGEVSDLRNQRTTPVGVEICSVVFGGSDFPDSCQALKLTKQVG